MTIFLFSVQSVSHCVLLHSTEVFSEASYFRKYTFIYCYVVHVRGHQKDLILSVPTKFSSYSRFLLYVVVALAVVAAALVAALVAARHAADFRSLLNVSYFW
jgi:hypothetical protein